MFIGVDIGGTFVKVGFFNGNEKVGFIKLETPKETNGELFFDIIASSIIKNLESLKVDPQDIQHIGVCMPGNIDTKNGIFVYANNFSFTNINVKNVFAKHFSCNVKLSHDVSMAAFAEQKLGCLKDVNDAVYIALGTGFGCAIIENGLLNNNRQNYTCEYGHTTYKLGGYPCKCGRLGCIDMYLSTTGIIREAKALGLVTKEGSMAANIVFDLYNTNEHAKSIVDNFLDGLGEVLLNIINTFRPQKIVIGGGLAYQITPYFDKILLYLQKYNYGYKSSIKTSVVVGSLLNDASLTGAALNI